MARIRKFDISKLNGKVGQIRDWLKRHHFPIKAIFIITGISSTIWFLIRVIPKPSRASYPCMQVAAPVMSGFIVYLLSLTGITIALRKAKMNIFNSKYLSALLFIIFAIAVAGVAVFHGSQDVFSINLKAPFGPDDGPNKPIGEASGTNPGRVVWIWNPEATNENCTNDISTRDFYFTPENTNQKVVSDMLSESIRKLSGKPTIRDSWDSFFIYLNMKKHKAGKGYKKGEKIFIKINQGTARWLLTQDDKNAGYYFPKSVKAEETRIRESIPPTEANPYVVLAILNQLVNELGIDQSDIAVGDPMAHIYGHNYDVWHNAFPDIVYIDKISDKYGRTMIYPTEKDLLFYSDKTDSDKLYNIIEDSDYLINIANFKPHLSAGITLTAKNHFGSQARESASHLHYSLIAPRGRIVTNDGYKKYRVLVDLMGSKFLGQNTVLYIVDGLFGGGASETKPPVKYFMEPFNNDWCNSIFLSQDQVALESVCYDFLRTEWNGINSHNPVNNIQEASPNYHGADDYLHQAADRSNWPDGIKYDPDGNNNPISSLGTHEHWNNPQLKQYSGNLGFSAGIELLSIPENLVRTVPRQMTVPQSLNSLGPDITARIFSSVVVDNNNTKWFISDEGIISFDGKSWKLHNRNQKIPSKGLRNFTFEISSYGPELWIATENGATVASLPIDARTGATTYYTENSKILSNDVRYIAIGKNPLRWIGTNKGISAFYDSIWLTPSYQRTYPANLFVDYPITSMATSPGGDTLYAGTAGAGVSRVYKKKSVDAISGASEYAQWGTILMPSDNVYSIYIAPDGTQWIGTDSGIACHKGHNTLKDWTIYNNKNGLVSNFVQSITMDNIGNMWFGTKDGISVFDGTVWTSYRQSDGLTSNNVLCIAADKTGTVWIGTDNGVNSFKDGIFTSYK